jgi:hypothetical protein
MHSFPIDFLSFDLATLEEMNSETNSKKCDCMESKVRMEKGYYSMKHAKC